MCVLRSQLSSIAVAVAALWPWMLVCTLLLHATAVKERGGT